MKRLMIVLTLVSTPAMAWEYKDADGYVQPPQASGYRVQPFTEEPIDVPKATAPKLERYNTTDGDTLWLYRHTNE